MQSILVFIIIIIATFYVGWRLFKAVTKTQQNGCGCSCIGCDSDENTTAAQCSKDTVDKHCS